ncbi:MAG TPA: hypothetical protein VNT75_16050 [Symbiobacteriaceae bacterium]|nr:hypothetical protein [Symbiobacteriaceae bacterium]
MPGKENEKKIQGTSFRKVTKSYNSAGGALREPPKIVVSPTGASRGNTEAKLMAQDFVRQQGGDPESFQFVFGGSEEMGQLALYNPLPGESGVMKVSLHDNSLLFHAGAAFEEHPKLRPVTTVDCSVVSTVDSEGTPCLVVQIHGATPTRTVKRKKKNGTDKAKPAEGEGKKE